MFSIGEFASTGRVSVRMLRHYDRIGLLRPAYVDESSGYRYYQAQQLQRLNRLMALKDLGFTLEQIGTMVDDSVEPAELRGMLQLRQAQLAEQIATDTDRLVRVEARLRIIEKEGSMSTQNVEIKSVEPVRVSVVSGESPSTDPADVGPVIQGLFGELMGTLHNASASLTGTAIATYAPTADGRLTVQAGFPTSAPVSGLSEVELPAVPEAACYVYEGAMAGIGEAYQTLATWIDDQGFRTDGTAREVYLVSYPEPEERWQTELQMPIQR